MSRFWSWKCEFQTTSSPCNFISAVYTKGADDFQMMWICQRTISKLSQTVGLFPQTINSCFFLTPSTLPSESGPCWQTLTHSYMTDSLCLSLSLSFTLHYLPSFHSIRFHEICLYHSSPFVSAFTGYFAPIFCLIKVFLPPLFSLPTYGVFWQVPETLDMPAPISQFHKLSIHRYLAPQASLVLSSIDPSLITFRRLKTHAVYTFLSYLSKSILWKEYVSLKYKGLIFKNLYLLGGNRDEEFFFNLIDWQSTYLKD